MILVLLQGGLGNQMFQYAFGLMLSIKNKTELKIDCSLLNNNSKDEKYIKRGFDLDIFELEPNFASRKEVTFFNGYPNGNVINKARYKLIKAIYNPNLYIQFQHEFNDEQLQIKDNSCVVGRWQSELYFKEICDKVVACFELNPKYLLSSSYQKNIESSECAVAIHVRREDFSKASATGRVNLVNGVLDAKFYYDSFMYLNSKLSNAKYYIFSEDMEWCKANLDFIPNPTFVVNEKNKKGMAEDLFLISKCKHHIISNSTFSWWGAYLSKYKAKIVIAPKKWSFTGEEFEPPCIIPDTWVKI